MLSLFFAALFGSNSRNLDKTSNQQLFGYEQPQPPPQQQPPPPTQYYVNNPQLQQPPPNHRNSIISNNNNLNQHYQINNNNNNSTVNYHHQQPPPPSTSNSFRVSTTNNNNYPVTITNPYHQTPQTPNAHQIPPQNQQVIGYPQSQIVDHNPQQQPSYSSIPTPQSEPNYPISLDRPNLQSIHADSKPSAPTESFCNNNSKPSLNETINGNLNFVTQQPEQQHQILPQVSIQQPPTQFNLQQTINPPPQQPTQPTTTQPPVRTFNISVAGMPITIQQPVVQPVSQPDSQPVVLAMNATVSGNVNGFGLQPSNHVDITKPFTPISNTQVISTTPAFGQTVCYQQGYNNGIRVNQRVVQTGDQWTTEHEYGTYNVCFRISPTSGEHNPFSGLVLGVTGISHHKPPPGHTHFIVFNNVQQRIEKRAYPNDCRPAVAGARFMLMESVIIPYNLIASFEVDCVGGRVNKQSLSCVICMLTNGHSIRINHDEMDTVSLSSEKAKWLYQALNYSLAMLRHKQQQENTQASNDSTLIQ